VVLYLLIFLLNKTIEECKIMNKLFKYILENYNDGSEKVDSSIELYKALTKHFLIK